MINNLKIKTTWENVVVLKKPEAQPKGLAELKSLVENKARLHFN